MKCWCGGQASGNQADGPEGWVCLDSKFHDPFATGRPTEPITKLYLAGPMSGYPDCNYPAFREMSNRLRALGFEVVDPSSLHEPDRCHYVDLIRQDLVAMLECQGVATLENWWESTGARNEVQVAGILKMPVRPAESWFMLSPAARGVFPVPVHQEP